MKQGLKLAAASPEQYDSEPVEDALREKLGEMFTRHHEVFHAEAQTLQAAIHSSLTANETCVLARRQAFRSLVEPNEAEDRADWFMREASEEQRAKHCLEAIRSVLFARWLKDNESWIVEAAGRIALGKKEAAENALQEALKNLWKRLRDPKFTWWRDPSFDRRGYLYRIIQNAYRSPLRKKPLPIQGLLESHAAVEDDQFLKLVLQTDDLVASFCRRLSIREKAVLDLWLPPKSARPEEIGKAVGLRVSGVYNAMTRIIQKARRWALDEPEMPR
jgi:DNA-directed RNA polymerase specialized sigma24 family protein